MYVYKEVYSCMFMYYSGNFTAGCPTIDYENK